MDERTLNAKKFLDERFQVVDKDGYYVPHQPIYGFEKTLGNLNNYKRTFVILKEIEWLIYSGKIKNFLDLGCAEGYQANIVRDRFKLNTVCSDLSIEACRRAKNIFELDSFTSDSHSLPIKDNAIDLVLCSEMLEHVSDPESVLSELIRITKRFLIITTPAARDEKAKEEFTPDFGDPHGHISIFTRGELKELMGENIVMKGTRSLIIWRIDSIIFQEEFYGKKRQKFFVLYKAVKPLLQLMRNAYGIRMTKLLIFLDYVLSEAFPEKTCDHLLIKIKSGTYPKKQKPKKLDFELLDYLIVKNKVEKHILPEK